MKQLYCNIEQMDIPPLFGNFLDGGPPGSRNGLICNGAAIGSILVAIANFHKTMPDSYCIPDGIEVGSKYGYY